MNKKTLLKLEYNKIIDLLTEQASSFSGKERCRRLKPKTNLAEITLMQEEIIRSKQGMCCGMWRLQKKSWDSMKNCCRRETEKVGQQDSSGDIL